MHAGGNKAGKLGSGGTQQEADSAHLAVLSLFEKKNREGQRFVGNIYERVEQGQRQGREANTLTTRRAHRNGATYEAEFGAAPTRCLLSVLHCHLRTTGETLGEIWGPATRLHCQDLSGALNTVGINTDRMRQKCC